MAQKEHFFTNEIDRTPYSGCYWVGAVVIGLFLIGMVGLVRAAGYMKSHNSLQFSLPALPGSSTTENNILEKVQQAGLPATPDIQKVKDDAAKQAQDAIKEEANRQIQQQIDSAKDQLPK